MAYMWFIGINPDEDLPDPSLLAKFRTQRLKETTIDYIIQEIIIQCVEKGIVKGTGISIDATHSHANTIKKVPERIMKHLAKNVFRNLEEENGSIPEQLDKNIPDYKEIADHNNAKQTMKSYLEKVIEDIEESVDLTASAKTVSAMGSGLTDFINDLGIKGRSCIAFVIGGSTGLSDEVLKRVILLEQIYSV